MLSTSRVSTPVLWLALLIGCAEDAPSPGRQAPADSDQSPVEGKRDSAVARSARDASVDARARDASPRQPSKPDAGGEDPAPPQDAAAEPPPDAGRVEPDVVACSGKAGWKAGDTNGTISVGGTKRTYILHVPASYDGSKPVPLLLDFHPIFGSAAGQRRSSGYAELADKEGFLVAYADGIDNAWNFGPCCTRSRDVDDVELALAMVDKFSNEGCIDAKRVYGAGFSNGGGLSHYLGCKGADVFAAVSPSAFDLIEEVPCTPSRPISVVSFRGTADTVVPYAGGASKPPTPYPLDSIHFLGAQGTFKKWAEVDGCSGEPVAGTGGCKTYTKCKDGVEVTLCTAQGGGHATGDAKVAWPLLKKYVLP
jgi:poly(3-hydroxybutyrate) depolymerase